MFLLIIINREVYVKPEVGVSRTDLALEVHSQLQNEEGKVRGVEVENIVRSGGIKVNRIAIETENAAKEMGRPRGNYITIDFSESEKKGYKNKQPLVRILAQIIEEWTSHLTEKDGFTIGKQSDTDISVLVAGLGNAEEIIDALGPKVVSRIPKSRHIMQEFGKYIFGSKELSRISGIAPGVRDHTGMETQEIIKGIVGEIEPDLIITIDALVGKNQKRIGQTIQLTDAGIVPGSGVGVHRKAISKDSMGIPVISIGVPMVMDASYDFFLVPKDVTMKVEFLSEVIADGIEEAFRE